MAHQPRHVRQDRVRRDQAERGTGRDAGVSGIRGSGPDTAREAHAVRARRTGTADDFVAGMPGRSKSATGYFGTVMIRIELPSWINEIAETGKIYATRE